MAFAGTAFLQCPLTLDANAFRQNVMALDPGIIPQGGTALAQAVETSLEALEESGGSFRAIVLITDGEDHEEGAMEAARKAAGKDCRIFAVGVGTPEGELLSSVGEDGSASFLKDRQGNVIKSRLNQSLLEEMARATGGFYVSLQDSTSIGALYQSGLAPLPREEVASRLFKQPIDRFQWPLALALACLLAEPLISDRRKVRASQGPGPVGVRDPGMILRAAALPCLLVGGALLAQTEREAAALFGDGRHQEALEAYRALAEEFPGDTRLAYNAGVSAYRAGAMEEAGGLLRSRRPHAPIRSRQQRAHYNKANALYRAGESASDPGQRALRWESAIRSYDNALALEDGDSQARENREFVTRRLEELRRQQQEQQEEDPSQEQNQEQDQEDGQESSQEEEQQDQDSGQEEEAAQEPSPEEEGKDPESSQDQQEQESSQEEQNQNPGQEEEEAAQESSPGEEGEEPPGTMTREQALQLLDSLREPGRPMIFLPPDTPGRPVSKDW